jgi:hypothetical protein
MLHVITRWSVALMLTLGTALATGGGTPHMMQAAAAPPAPTINLAHLDFLHDTVPYSATTSEHGTTDPGTPIDTWWVYANYNSSSGAYTRTGGGTFNPATNTYGQGGTCDG